MAYVKKPKEEWKEIPLRTNFDVAGGVICRGCFDKKLKLDELKAEVAKLKAKIKRIEKVTKKDVANAHTPSSKIDFKRNSTEDHRSKKGGAKIGHNGSGRKRATEETAARIVELLPAEVVCPDCKGQLCRFDQRDRTVIEAMPLKAERVLYRAKRFRCSGCQKVVEPKPAVLPRFLYGNQLLAQSAVTHYVHGVPIGRVLEMFGPEITEGGLIQAFHRLGAYFDKAIPPLIDDYRAAQVRHADETGWRTDGHSGYAWLFATSSLSLLEFADNRSSRIPTKFLGTDPLPGVLIVDRYGGYNKMPVNLQYCYAHLLREVEKLENEFPEKEVIRFTSLLIPLLTRAMKLKGSELSSTQYYVAAKEIKKQMLDCLSRPYVHAGIKRIQQIFTGKEHRLYHWVKNRDVPSHNNSAERELRPTVIARKVSFGSQSDAGAKTRSRLMTVLLTAKKRLAKQTPIEVWLKTSLDTLAKNPSRNIYHLLPAAPS